jgi:hypothetical protein
MTAHCHTTFHVMAFRYPSTNLIGLIRATPATTEPADPK